MPRTVDSVPRRTRASRRLNLALILDAAVSLIERDGPDALSMRRLGSELGVEGMALYHHLAGREELLRAIGDRLLEPLRELELPEDWREACRRFATALRDVALAHPATFRLVGLQPFDSPASLRPVERLLGVLVAQGFTPADALAVYRAVASYARGYALAEATGFTVDAARPAGRRRLRALRADEFPILAGRADQLADLDPDSGYERGLRALLDGIGGPR
jgi:TetR/AcrR family tetracycline transcriptional repressor